MRRREGEKIEEINEIKGIYVDIERGERVEMIGKKGDGKSKLLKNIEGI